MGKPPHDKLHAYKAALGAVRLLRDVRNRLGTAHGELRDQMTRASYSMVLNLAEGAAEFSAAEKARFYRMSRRSSAECIAALDLVLIEAPEATGIDAAQEGLEQVMAMVTTLIHAMERRRGGNRSGIEG